jgi:hypothetical protein
VNIAASVPQNRIGMTRFRLSGSPAGAARGGPSIHLEQHITTHLTQSEKQVGDISAERLLFWLSLAGGTP